MVRGSLVSEGSSSNLDDYIFVPSRTVEEKRKKRPGRRAEPVSYESESDEEEEWLSKEFKDQISSTISTINGKEMKDVNHIYVVLGLLRRINDQDIVAILKALKAQVLVYLNQECTKLLVSLPLAKLQAFRNRRRAPKYIQSVRRIGPLLFREQVSENLRKDSEWRGTAKPLMVYSVPNISNEVRENQLRNILEYTSRFEGSLADYDEAGFILANLNEQSVRDLLRVSNFVFRVDSVPQALANGLRSGSARARIRRSKVKSQISSIDSASSPVAELPTICLMDSGINDIPQLRDIVFLKDGFTGFLDFNDGCSGKGHGTPVACLATYGEDLNEAKARIISYKVYSDDRPNVAHRGFLRAIDKYSQNTRIFLSSVNIDANHPDFVAILDNKIQAKNICVVFSAGNILPADFLGCIANGLPYPRYIPSFPIKSPAEAVTIMAVGAISKMDSTRTIAHANELAPFTTCGTGNPFLFDCPKPEVVQHGGNICPDRSTSGVGVRTICKDGSQTHDLVGTSFSAPLSARILAEIVAKYGQSIRNAETVKAIALAGSSREVRDCSGFGETTIFNCDRFQALICSEGIIPLTDTTGNEYNSLFQNEIHVRIPKSIEKIEMFIVHSDNYSKKAFPSLNTTLKVYAYKTGHERGAVKLDNPQEQMKKSHMKVFRWKFKTRSMEADWTFHVKPEAITDMLPEDRSQTTIRYGCSILITAKSTTLLESLSQEIRQLMAQRP
jgi:hypothetical protein